MIIDEENKTGKMYPLHGLDTILPACEGRKDNVLKASIEEL